jgi:hypothetical protein
MRDKAFARREALIRFERARQQARREQLTARLIGRDNRLLPFSAVRSELIQQNPFYRGVQQIPVDSIIGSVGRYTAFTRHFLPLTDSLRERWINVDALATTTGWPPIELYQVGNAYFVKDGNHRVSVARQIEAPTIEAHVWEYPADLEIELEEDLDTLFIQFGQRNFMKATGLDGKFPDHDIRFTSPGRYTELLAQIEDLRQILTHIDGKEIPYEEAVDAWYEMIYLPTVQIIHDSTLLTDFPGRTEADLFVWLSKHRDGLEEEYGQYESLAELAQLLADKYREGSVHKLTRQVRRLLGSDELPPLAEAPDETQDE